MDPGETPANLRDQMAKIHFFELWEFWEIEGPLQDPAVGVPAWGWRQCWYPAHRNQPDEKGWYLPPKQILRDTFTMVLLQAPTNLMTAGINSRPQSISTLENGNPVRNSNNIMSLQVCALVSKVQPCHRHPFCAVFFFTSRGVDGWFELFPVLDESPAHHVRDIRAWIEGNHSRVDDCLSRVGAGWPPAPFR